MRNSEFDNRETNRNGSKWRLRRLWPLAVAISGLTLEVVAYQAVPVEHRAKVRITDDYAFRGVSITSESGYQCEAGYERFSIPWHGGWKMSRWTPVASCHH
jgi:hypothetical protein